MMSKRFLGLAGVLLASLLMPVADAADLAASRSEFRRALAEVERGAALNANQRRSLASHPLHPYLQYAELRHRLNRASRTEVAAFLQRHADLPIAERLRRQWLSELARRQDWQALLADWQPQDDSNLACQHARALFARGDAGAVAAAEALWLTGGSAPAACDAVFAELQRRGHLDHDLRWRRIELAAGEGNSALIRYLARNLPAPARDLAESYARFLEAPAVAGSRAWPVDARSREIAVIGLQRLARNDADRAEDLLDPLAAALALDASQRGRVRAAIALWSAASYRPEAARRLALVPATSFDARLHEWRAREALARNDYAALREALAAMPDAQRNEPRWRYLAARSAELTGDRAAAEAGFRSLAGEAHYHAFLAADRVQAGYALCPLEPSSDLAVRQALQQHAGLTRALELRALQRNDWALLEWNTALATLSAEQRRLAVQNAVDAGWTDRAVFDLASGDDLRYYRLRFPLAHQRHLSSTAQARGLDAAWVAALIRAESAWQPTVRSHANAYGLMQLLPGTAAPLAKRLGLPWQGSNTLLQPISNISLGTAYLADMLERKGQQPYLATAAYNAGPTPVARWRRERPPRDADLWIETIPYKETRDYVVRVMAFSVIYDWRLGRDAYPLSARLLGQPDSTTQRRPFACPTSPASLASQP